MKYIYNFNEGNKDMKNILGGKGANLAEMTSLGIAVPSGFTISSEVCNLYYENNKELPKEIEEEIEKHIEDLEKISGKKFGDLKNPLLVSVRSGARVSMPGMMDTILNLGLNDEVANSFAKKTNNERFAYDCYRRFIQMYADVVMNLPKSSFEGLFDRIKEEKGVKLDTDLTSLDLKEIVSRYKDEYQKLTGKAFPSSPKEQLLESVKAVFRSWNNERAITYRRINDIPSIWGTAVNVQEMVYGNGGENSGTGVAFTRNPSTGEKKLYGEYLINAQGEDVVAGIRTPQEINTLKEVMPKCYDEFVKICDLLEKHYRDMQDMEFTIEDGKLYILQTRNGKRTAQASIKIAVDLVKEGMITKEEALMKVDARSLDQLLHNTFSENSLKNGKVIAKGLPASPGAGFGKIYFSASKLKTAKENGEENLILVRNETSPEDIEGMLIANGILTIRGGMTSHAAVVARGMGTPCVSGCEELKIDEDKKILITKGGLVFNEKDYISLDGSTGMVYGEKLEMVMPTISGDFETFMNWADSYRKLGIRANADNKKDAKYARMFGAEGIGLCRTEHMFFNEERIFNFRKMIVSNNTEERIKALNNILPYQRSDFEDLYKEMKGYPVTIRLLDPPLHEFLPKEEDEIEKLAISLNISKEELHNRIEHLKEFNPMMGHRGCRLIVTYPEIAKMQTRAIIEAGLNVKKEGIEVTPEIMIPLICDLKELEYVKNIITEEINEIFKEKNEKIKYLIGTMIELPRACLISDELAKSAEFFSYGTNDLTQMTYGFSRDDASKFLNDYYSKFIFETDPFAKVDDVGVGELMKISIEKGKKTRPDIKLGICGEHGGDPSTIEFCNKIGLDYVSCSPFRIPIARLAAAKSAINAKNNK